jgi:hypothetical protein
MGVTPMSKISENVALDPSTWERIDAEQRRSGLSRDEVIDRAVRRSLGGRVLDALFERVRERSPLTEEEAFEIATDETDAFRAERDSVAHIRTDIEHR